MKRSFRVMLFLVINALLIPSPRIESHLEGLQILRGGTLSARVTAEDIQTGFLYLLGQMELKVIASDGEPWKVTAQAFLLSFPPGATDPGPQAIEIKDNTTGTFIAGGGLIQAGQGPMTFLVDIRLNLQRFGDSKVGLYQFRIDYTISKL